MKKSDLFKIGVLLMATTLGTTGCSFGEDEKKPEIVDRKSTRLNSSHNRESRMPSSA